MSGGRLADAVAAGSSRRGFLARVGGAVLGVAGARALAQPPQADAYHFCGHIYTTDSCPHPTGLPRINKQGFPLKAADGSYPDPWDHKVFNLILKVEFPSGIVSVSKDIEPF